jgi:hypothetical protein
MVFGAATGSGWLWRHPRDGQGNLLHILVGCGEQALLGHSSETAEAAVTMAVKLFGVGKAALNGFLSPFIETLAPIGQAVGLDAILGILPDVPSDDLGRIGARGAGREQRAGLAERGVGLIFPMAIDVILFKGLIEMFAEDLEMTSIT